MAKVNIAFTGLMGAGAPVYTGFRVNEVITSSTSNQVSANASTGNEYVSITSSGGDVNVMIGQAPVASTAIGQMVQSGATKEFGPLKVGDKVAVIDA